MAAYFIKFSPAASSSMAPVLQWSRSLTKAKRSGCLLKNLVTSLRSTMLSSHFILSSHCVRYIVENSVCISSRDRILMRDILLWALLLIISDRNMSAVLTFFLRAVIVTSWLSYPRVKSGALMVLKNEWVLRNGKRLWIKRLTRCNVGLLNSFMLLSTLSGIDL